jgi:hypothetical protein
MSVIARVEPLERDIALLFPGDFSPEARSQALAEFAREALADAQQSNARALGRTPPHETFVDGTPGGNEDAVRPDGTIAYEFELFDEALAWIGEQLVIHSPVKTGRYQRSHVVLADGEQVLVGEMLPPAREYVFVNVQPYARRIEHGYSKQAPEGVYQGVAVMASRRFGNLARISFTYRSVVGLGRQPAIVLTVR